MSRYADNMKALLLAGVLVSGCGAAAPVAPTPVPSPRGLDVLAFVIGAETLWPRTGDQLQHQVVDRDARRVCWVKYGRADMFECWTWDDDWIYHRIDHALDGDSGESYAFSDGRWLPRWLPTEHWSLDVPDNRLFWLTPTCEPMSAREGIPSDTGRNLFPYVLQAWIEHDVPIGGDLGVRDVLTLTYASYPPGGHSGPPETFRFAKGAGWYAWSSPRGSRSFPRLGGPVVTPTSTCRLRLF